MSKPDMKLVVFWINFFENLLWVVLVSKPDKGRCRFLKLTNSNNFLIKTIQSIRMSAFVNTRRLPKNLEGINFAVSGSVLIVSLLIVYVSGLYTRDWIWSHPFLSIKQICLQVNNIILKIYECIVLNENLLTPVLDLVLFP